ncbi:hypothetical protein tb265_18600 [Gemmatimonadetes bacterium T265]|nr:hypothetical protein tb265_18600 [Gemmatimonadetes bacterium T265]
MPGFRVILGLTAALAACTPGGPAPAARPDHHPPPVSQPAAPESIYHAQMSQYPTGEETVLRDRAAWEAAWAQLNNGMVAPPLPAVDFTTSSVVLVAIGPRSSGGYDVRVTNVRRDGPDTVVDYTVTEPGPGCMTAAVMTAPVDVVRVPRPDGVVRFARRTVRRPC